MCGNLRRTAGAFLAALMLLASFPAYAVEEREEDGVSAEAVEEALSGEESREELEEPEDPWEEPETPEEGVEEVPPETPEETAEEAPPETPVTLSVEPESGTWGNLSWSLDSEGTLTISGTGAMRSNPPWNWSNDIKRVVIEPGVTSIGDEAFYRCTGLSSITIPDSVVSIGYEAFYGCTGLTGITIPESVTSIGDEAFYGCTSLVSVIIPKNVTSIGDEAFYNCSSLTGITIPKNVTSIGDEAFYNCSSLTGITIPESVTSIGYMAFYNCSSLTSVTIPKNVTSIEDRMFSGCSALTSITIPENVTWIGYEVFSGCTGLTSAGPIGDDNDYSYRFGWKTAIPEDAFKGCTGLTSVTIPEGVSSIGSSAFSGCTGLTSITVPASVTEIGYYTFSGCTGLETAGPIGSGSGYQFGWTSAIPDYAFKGCSGLTSVTIPASITKIGSSAFSGCTGLETAGPIGSGSSYEFGWTVAIPEYAFKGCTGLTSVTLPENLASICRGAFSGCEKLKSITIPASVEKIESGAFSGCTGLTSAGPIGGNYGYQFGWTAAIPENAFYNCSSLTSVTIPGGVTSIGASAFYKCSGLTGITLPKNITAIRYNTFSDCTGLTSIAIPESVTSIGRDAFKNCTALTRIVIPASTAKIEDQAFSGCIGLTSAGPAGGNYSYQFGWRTAIPDNAFSGCGGLTRVVIPRDIASVSYKAFLGCGSLAAIEVSGENTSYSSVGGVLFNRAGTELMLYPRSRQGEYDIPGGVTSVGPYAFYDCESLTGITIPEGVSSIGSWAFGSCTGLAGITLPTSVTSVGDRAFSCCSGLKTAGPAGGNYDLQFSWRTAIPDYAFSGCADLTSVTIPDSVTSIGSSAFESCTGLTGIDLPGGVTAIGSSAFSYCTALTGIDLPEGLISIGYRAFNSSGLTGVVIPGSVKSIGDNAFSWCRDLASITIPDSVTSIGYDAFWYCSPNLCIYCYPGSPAESYAVENNLHYALLRRGDGDVSTWLSVNAPSGVTAGETFLVRTGYSALNAARLELGLPEGAVLSSLWLDGRPLSAGDYTRSGNSLAVPVSGLAEAPAHTLYLYCTASSAGSHRISGRLVMVNGEAHSLGAAAVRVSDAWLSVPERVGYPEGILATGKTAPGRTVTLFVDGVQAGAATSNSAGSWRIPFNLTEAGSHTVYAEIELPDGNTVLTAEAHVEYRPCAVYPLKLTMYNTGDHGAQATEFTFTDPDAANLIRYYRIWPSRFPSFTFKAEFSGDPSTLSGVSVVTVNGAGVETVIPAAYNGNSHAWVASYEYTEFENAPVWVYVSCPGVCSGRLSAVPIMDPSGYVYEAVPSNRLAGVQAEIYYQKDGGEVLWNAASFDQANPQTTGPDGSYYWDVPAGHWKVRFTKDGYGSAETDWLPVPPPQVGINVPMASTAKPEVKCAAVYGDHAEVTFSQYMKIDSVKSAITLNGSAPASVEALDAEDSGSNAVQYATRFKAVAVESLSGRAQLSVSAEAANYAGKNLAAAYTKSLPVEVCPERITAPERVDMEMSDRQNIRVTLESDNSGISGRKLTVENLTPAIISVDKTSVTTGEGGTVEIPVTSLLPGTGILRISEPASGLSADVTVQVEAAVKPEVSIKASLAGRVLTYSVQNVDEQANAKLLAAGYDGGRMSGAVILQGMSGTWTLPDAPSGSYVLFLLEADTWRPLCPRVTVPKQ